MAISEREQRGLIIAALCKLNKTPKGWIVPSQSKSETLYQVNLKLQTCTCPDHQEAGFKCKHLYAAEFTMKREVHADGSVTDTQSVTFTKKVTYKQDWPAYNRAQSIEKDRFQELLNDLCSGLEEPKRDGRGRPPHPVKDTVFSSIFKVYSGFSSRRFTSDIREAHARGYLGKAFPGVKTVAFLERPSLTPILKSLVARSAMPLRAVTTAEMRPPLPPPY